MKYLIVSADDFGMSKSVNAGIIKAYKEGIVSYLNFMPAGAAFSDALEFTKDVKLPEIGAHLSLTGVSPVTDPSKIPALLNKDNKFHKNYAHFFLNFFSGRIDRGQIYLELKNQLDLLKKTNIPITSLSSHEHIHMVPSILDIFIKLAKEYNIPSIRCLSNEKLAGPATAKKIYKKLLLPLFVKGIAERLRKAGIYFADNLLGFIDSGALQEDSLLKMFAHLPGGFTELVCHPGLVSGLETELRALTGQKIKDLVKEGDIRLAKFGDLIAKKREGR